ncbi:M1 family metallopeptidase [Chitinophaga sancti]|uniref:M1 family metallopeptidase n=1 Tax=Chitinophaga sancti TaxID=1004 RepID=A0A1K1NEP4_9BACT|nr:M1 family metallopeptidase [Chitinophaga sancti]WQD63356.1 M1 family metallopeptidase [Chitinophaga sancti]WQG91018.1 M1 family metallopeptidase [Chitinophaga sancti]SFW32886.1 Peptidase family M1 [Chitinophaga sancti]
MRGLLLLLMAMATALSAGAQERTFTHADTLRGSITSAREWWDVQNYELNVALNAQDSTLGGSNTITYFINKPDSIMQIDLQLPMEVDSVMQDKQKLAYERDGDAVMVRTLAQQPKGATKKVTIFFHGRPKTAVNPPWDGGIIWRKDKDGRPWIATACQGLGASVWWPNKDTQSDEPNDMTIAVTVPNFLVDVSNGRLKKKVSNKDGTDTYIWYVANPINNYDVALNIGNYKEIKDTYNGEGGKLDLSYWVLDYNVDTATIHFAEVKKMLACFEFWFGKYPFYQDSYKLVEAPHLGMEHQSAVAYGNGFGWGYKGRDLSGTGWGLKWDFIIVHESGHEWFGNNITSKDLADMWIHEAFTNYSETLYTECEFGRKAAFEYIIGVRQNIRNDIPIIAPYGVNAEGSGDMYYKGGNMVHTIRQIINNDNVFRDVLRGMNQTFWHQTVTTKDILDYLNYMTQMNFKKVFEQYLMHTTIPTLEYHFNGNELQFRWVTDVENFDMPVKVTLNDRGYQFIYPGKHWQSTQFTLTNKKDFKVDPNFYINIKQI